MDERVKNYSKENIDWEKAALPKSKETWWYDVLPWHHANKEDNIAVIKSSTWTRLVDTRTWWVYPDK